MSKMIAVVAATDRPTQAMLAAEALKKAATTLGHSLAVELRAGDAVTGGLAADRSPPPRRFCWSATPKTTGASPARK